MCLFSEHEYVTSMTKDFPNVQSETYIFWFYMYYAAELFPKHYLKPKETILTDKRKYRE